MGPNEEKLRIHRQLVGTCKILSINRRVVASICFLETTFDMRRVILPMDVSEQILDIR